MSKQIKWAFILLVLVLIPVSAQKLKIAGRVTKPGNGIFYIDCQIVEEGTYEVQRAAAVTSRFWTTISNFTTVPGNYTVQEPMSGPGRYYRLVRLTNAPAITAQPVGLTNYAGSEIKLTAAVSGSAPLRLQWYRNGQPVTSGGQGTNLVLPSESTVSGAFTLVATNPWGKATSQVAQVKVLSIPPATISGKSIQFTILNQQGTAQGNYTTVFNAQGFYNTTGSSPLLNDTGYWLYGVLNDASARILLPGSIAYPDGQITLMFQDQQNGTYNLVVPGFSGSQSGRFQFLN